MVYPEDKREVFREERGRIVRKERGGPAALLVHDQAQWEEEGKGSRVLGDSRISLRTSKLRDCSGARVKRQWILLMTGHEF